MTASQAQARPTAAAHDEPPPTQPALGPVGWARWAWRQLTSMRTALLLLLLLAVAAIPGSVLPQRNIDAGRVSDYLARHSTIGPWLDRVSLFDVYASPWFASVYLLLLVSLVGCVVPRSRAHWQALRTPPPRTPARLTRLPVHTEVIVDAGPDEVAAALRAVLRRRRYRLRRQADGDGGAVSAQRGQLRETGNLLFHTALIVVIAAVGARYLWGWRGDVIVPAGQTFASTASGYGTLSSGPFVDTGTLPPFSVRVDRMDVTFEDRASGAQFGAPRDFIADTTTTTGPKAAPVRQRLTVNNPLSLSGTSVFLLGNGYAPVVTVRDKEGNILYREPTPFLPQDNNYRSVGAIKVSAAAPKQLGFTGMFLPTAAIDPTAGPVSVFPDTRAPALVLTMFEGEIFPAGRPQSVYSLKTDGMSQVRTPDGQPLRLWLTPGKTVTLPGGRGTITLEGVERFAGLSVRYDPGKGLALVGALTALGGLVLSLTIRRRRVFARLESLPVGAADAARPDHARTGSAASLAAERAAESRPHTRVVLAGISKGDDPGLAGELDRIAAHLHTFLTSAQRGVDRLPKPEKATESTNQRVAHSRPFDEANTEAPNACPVPPPTERTNDR